MGMGGAFWAIVGEHSICSRGILRRRPLPRDIAASRRGEQCSPEGFHAAAHCHGRTMFAPTAHIWLCVGAAKRRRPGNYAHLAGGYRIRPYAWGFCPPLRDWRYKATVDTVDTVGHANRLLAYPPLPPPKAICSLAIYHTVNFYIINGCS